MSESDKGLKPKGGKKLHKRPMTNWYSPIILVATAIRVAISTVFGQFADRREAIAASNAIEPQPFDEHLDYSDAKGDFWFDYLADTGDGWNSTYAMARLVSQPKINVEGQPGLARGEVLILGGDQVYPFASREDYDERFLAPFEAAYSPSGKQLWKRGKQDLYAIPGNHDWYDGLNAFFGLFCRRRVKPKSGIGFDRDGRVIAGRATNQTRSYFAIRLPRGWWLWATDAQLEGYIDQPQIDFFRHVARYWMAEGSKVILCVDGPSWAYLDPKNPEPKFENFAYLERIAGAETDDDGRPKNHQLKAVLTGDSHHYSRYVEEDRHYITCGGGGAFLHPTHQLKDKAFDWKYPPPGQVYDPKKSYRRDFRIAKGENGAEALYPSRPKSAKLAFWNFAFAAINYLFTLTLFSAYAIFHWLLHFNARAEGNASSLSSVLRNGDLGDSLSAYWLNLVFASPAATLLILVALGGYIYAADAKNWPWRIVTGALHAGAQAALVTLTTCVVIRWLPPIGIPFEIAIAAAAAAIVSSTLYGLYLLIMLNLFHRHWNEGFSSFAHRGFKSMLRMQIGKDGALTIFPIGLEQVPRDRGKILRDPPLQPHLIEEPIRIT